MNKEGQASPKGNEAVGGQLEVPFLLLCQLDFNSSHLGNSRMNLEVSISFEISFVPSSTQKRTTAVDFLPYEEEAKCTCKVK